MLKNQKPIEPEAAKQPTQLTIVLKANEALLKAEAAWETAMIPVAGNDLRMEKRVYAFRLRTASVVSAAQKSAAIEGTAAERAAAKTKKAQAKIENKKDRLVKLVIKAQKLQAELDAANTATPK